VTDEPAAPTAEPAVEERPEGDTWTRSSELLGVSFPERTIEMVVMPYDSPTFVAWGARRIRETIARGAFDGIERRANRVRVNVDHEETVPATIGRAVAFHPSRDEGLVAEVKIARTALGDDTLTLAADGDLGASAGFLPMKDGLRWENRQRDAYTVTRAFLKHIAMTPDPAYDGARVLSVRHAAQLDRERPDTPNLDQVRAWRLGDRYASLDR
jgi:HK97 family phage prohead protease